MNSSNQQCSGKYHSETGTGLNLIRNSQLLVKFARYFLVGGLAAITEWLSFFCFIHWLHWYYIFAAVLSFIGATAVNHILSRAVVFKGGRHSLGREVLLVYIVSAVGLVINLAALSALVELAGINVLVSKVAATGTAFLWNFISRHLWVFER